MSVLATYGQEFERHVEHLARIDRVLDTRGLSVEARRAVDDVARVCNNIRDLDQAGSDYYDLRVMAMSEYAAKIGQCIQALGVSCFHATIYDHDSYYSPPMCSFVRFFWGGHVAWPKRDCHWVLPAGSTPCPAMGTTLRQ